MHLHLSPAVNNFRPFTLSRARAYASATEKLSCQSVFQQLLQPLLTLSKQKSRQGPLEFLALCVVYTGHSPALRLIARSSSIAALCFPWLDGVLDLVPTSEIWILSTCLPGCPQRRGDMSWAWTAPIVTHAYHFRSSGCVPNDPSTKPLTMIRGRRCKTLMSRRALERDQNSLLLL